MESCIPHKICYLKMTILVFLLVQVEVESVSRIEYSDSSFVEETIFDPKCLTYLTTGRKVEGTMQLLHDKEFIRTKRDLGELEKDNGTSEAVIGNISLKSGVTRNNSSSVIRRDNSSETNSTDTPSSCVDCRVVYVFCTERSGWPVSPQVIALSAALATTVVTAVVTFLALIRARKVWTCKKCEEARRQASVYAAKEAKQRAVCRMKECKSSACGRQARSRGRNTSKQTMRFNRRFRESRSRHLKARAPLPPGHPRLNADPQPPGNTGAGDQVPESVVRSRSATPAAASSAFVSSVYACSAAAAGALAASPPPTASSTREAPATVNPAPSTSDCGPGLYDPSAPLLSSSSSMALKGKKLEGEKTKGEIPENEQVEVKYGVIVPFHYKPSFSIRPFSP